MNRSTLIKEKQDEIRRHLAQWNHKESILRPGEFLFFSIGISRLTDSIVVPAEVPEAVESSPWTTELNEEDWNFLHKCNWRRQEQRLMIAIFAERNNKPAKRAEIEKIMGKNCMRSLRSALRRDAQGGKYRYDLTGTGHKTVATYEYQLIKKLR